MSGPFTVYVSWAAGAHVPACETSTECGQWEQARSKALHLSCLRGVRYITVQDADDVVVGDYDRITNRWREYAHSPARGA